MNFADLCFTTGGPSPDSWCQLPFKYNGKTYTKCTYDDSYDGRPWCSVNVNKTTREHIEEKAYWGYCDTTCPLMTFLGIYVLNTHIY